MTKKEKDIIQGAKNILDKIEDEAICCRYCNMQNWQREVLSKEELFDFAEEMRRNLLKILDLAMDLRLVELEKIKID